MKFKNFKLVEFPSQQIIEIDYLGEIFDLHNAAEFIKIEYVIKTSTLILFWNYYYNENNIIPIQIELNNCSSFLIFPRDSEMPREEDDCLEEIIYNKQLEFKFMGGMKISIEAEEAIFRKD